MPVHLRPFLAAAFALLALPAAARPQIAAAAANASAPHALFITILEGEGALNDVRARTAREPIVEITDENHKPVAGALVLFVSDTNGGGGLGATFNGAQAFSTSTDAEGHAVGRGFQITHATGKFHITVQASKGNSQTQAVITETNLLQLTRFTLVNHAAALATSKAGLLVTLELAALGSVTGVVVADALSTSTTVIPGTGTVGPPPTATLRFALHRRAR